MLRFRPAGFKGGGEADGWTLLPSIQSRPAIHGPSMPTSDSESTIRLVHAAQSGQRAALDLLFERYLPRVRQVVALRLGRSVRILGDVDDVVQDALMKAFRGLQGFEERSEGTFCNWLSRCAEAAVVDAVRHERARKRGGAKVPRISELDPGDLSSSIFAGSEPTPSNVARGKELNEKIERALLSMEPHQRELIILRKLEGMSYAEIGTALGIKKEVTVRVACTRALRKLKAAIEE